MAHRKDSVRVSLRLSKEVKARLDDVCERSSSESLTEVIRRSLTLYDALLEETDRGSTIVLRDKDGNEKEVMLIF